MSTLEAFCIQCLWYWRDASKVFMVIATTRTTLQSDAQLCFWPTLISGWAAYHTSHRAKSRVWNDNVVSVLIWCCQRDLRAVSSQHPFQNCSPTGIQTESLIHWTKTSNGKVQSWVIPSGYEHLFFWFHFFILNHCFNKHFGLYLTLSQTSVQHWPWGPIQGLSNIL